MMILGIYLLGYITSENGWISQQLLCGCFHRENDDKNQWMEEGLNGVPCFFQTSPSEGEGKNG